ncbi:DUF6440 family protein [Limosilactobacillus reuteri]|jgi:hypothetical protein|uniref:DUF6440 family protein n=2 Tax=Limosilactobacillus reuteri TaxID=1598 RepID=A0AAW4X4S7_LIMRT|nr:DUF6440 family protein [Limosilactobacillus reuteri]MCC4477414.1 DUF6440 family protein [Limosilactobacillus reuteri]MCC4479691.1 DUF6440 family protein [Limosilactobacillus reuteri]MCC4489003.1 DUF6440 family protein [Limosilactobacillus reuteri]MCC4496030.1 DUF6440 family protein [Limosilactobacillus reuteri]MCC4497466.1 DUF6440 family protein [Limosilactobacillus reuteri]
MKKWLIRSLVITIVFLTGMTVEGCTSKNTSADSNGILNNFDGDPRTQSYVATDKETKVQYLVVENRNNEEVITITPRLNKDGKPMIDGE